jgi:hypothetical protein
MFMSGLFITACRSHRPDGYRLWGPFGSVPSVAQGAVPKQSASQAADALCASSFEEIVHHG